jgi:hypothetical protein
VRQAALSLGAGYVPAFDMLRPDGSAPISDVASSLLQENKTINQYEVTFINGETVEIEARTPEAAGVIALEDAELEGRTGLAVASVELLKARQLEL